ncbi:MAG: hypothetical protein IPM35_36870 [Myxococcales bacterium]|nr:hypothetical protein [Myxococcales bacterium]
MVGGLVLRGALDDLRVGRVSAIGRRPTGVSHPKLEEVLQEDFLDYSGVTVALEGQDVALYCIGAYTGQLPDDEFRRVTLDYTVAFARALFARSPGATFCFLSGQGADQTGKSRMAFARYKGAAEAALLGVGFPRAFIFRPGYIYPVTPRVEPNFSYRLMRGLYPALRFVYPNVGVTSEVLASAMLKAGLEGTGAHDAPVLENRDIVAFGKA